MNSEFHYYTVAFLAVKAGLSTRDAEDLGYASQYVDHNLSAWKILDNGQEKVTTPTQNYRYWEPEVVRQILIPFHFLPMGTKAAPSVRLDGRTHLWDVRPNSKIAKDLLIEALETRDPMRIGIALHSFCDTWAHQNFSALREEWNRLEERSFIPPVGHAQARTLPDDWWAEWEDSRLIQPHVVNRERFLAAAHKVYRYLCVWKGKNFRQDEQDVASELLELIEKARGRESSQERMLDLVFAADISPYDRTSWFEEACEPPDSPLPDLDLPFWSKLGQTATTFREKTGLGGPISVRTKERFAVSRFHRWQNAADDHRQSAFRRLDEAFPQWKDFEIANSSEKKGWK